MMEEMQIHITNVSLKKEENQRQLCSGGLRGR